MVDDISIFYKENILCGTCRMAVQIQSLHPSQFCQVLRIKLPSLAGIHAAMRNLRVA